VVSAVLGWEVEIARCADHEAFALIVPCYSGDLVFTLTKEKASTSLRNTDTIQSPLKKS
jgi:hypothetical protein